MQMHSKIVGSTFCDSQELFKKLSKGEELTLVPEPENKFDDHAIRVENQYGDKLGYIPRATAYDLFEEMLLDIEYKASVAEITGQGKDNAGCNILIWSE